MDDIVEEKTADDAFKLSESPAHLLRRAQQLATEVFADLGMSDGVTLRQSVVLAAVSENEGLSQSKLVSETGIDRSTLADMIARMETRGLVERTVAEDDARAKSVRLTAEGRARLEEALPAMRSVDDALLNALPKNRRKSFMDVLSILTGDEVDEDGKLKKSKKGKDGKKKKKKKKKH